MRAAARSNRMKDMDNVYESLQRVDIAVAVAYFGVTELLDHIGKTAISEYLDSFSAAAMDAQSKQPAAIPIRRNKRSTTVRLATSQKITIATAVVGPDLIDVTIELGE